MGKKITIRKEFLEKINSKVAFAKYTPKEDTISDDFKYIQDNINEFKAGLKNDDVSIDDFENELVDFFADYAAYIKFEKTQTANQTFDKMLSYLDKELGINKTDVVNSFNIVFKRENEDIDFTEKDEFYYKRKVNNHIENLDEIIENKKKEAAKVEPKVEPKVELKIESPDITIEGWDKEIFNNRVFDAKKFNEIYDKDNAKEQLEEWLEDDADEYAKRDSYLQTYPTLKQNWDDTHWYDFFLNNKKFMDNYKAYKNCQNALVKQGFSKNELSTFADVVNGKIDSKNIQFKVSNKTVEINSLTTIESIKNDPKMKNVYDKLEASYKDEQEKVEIRRKESNEEMSKISNNIEENERVFDKYDDKFIENQNVPSQEFKQKEDKEITKESEMK